MAMAERQKFLPGFSENRGLPPGHPRRAGFPDISGCYWTGYVKARLKAGHDGRGCSEGLENAKPAFQTVAERGSVVTHPAPVLPVRVGGFPGMARRPEGMDGAAGLLPALLPSAAHAEAFALSGALRGGAHG